MAKKATDTDKTNLSQEIADYVDRKIQEEDLEDILGERFARYSKYIILDRALPDARDGLKPVQRRILFAMYKLGMFHDKPYRKSARIVGEVIGKYHPHGDTSVYDAMIRMSQPFRNSLPLIDVHGNNGSIDGDPAAAMRYTEARLSIYAEYLLQDINKKTVGFVPNFDDEELEPVVLPGKFPNLLVNGASGISSGYATEIPPHNVAEVIKAALYRIEHPNCSVSSLMAEIKGPDFPGGAIIEGLEGLKDAYATGKGKIVVKSRLHEEQAKNGNPLLVVTEIPYNVNKAVLVRQMSEVATRKSLDGIVDIRDESDREGLRVVVEMKKDANADVIKNFFYKYSQLSCNYTFNMTVIIDKRPQTVGLRPLLDAYLDHQKDVLTNRSNYELRQSQRRLEIVDGLISMTSILDAVIATIRSSRDKKDAKLNLIAQYDFTEAQAEAIVTLQLYRLTNTDVVALEKEKLDLKRSIERLNQILSNEDLLIALVKDELKATLATLAVDRRTAIEHEVTDIDVATEEILAREDDVVYATRDGYLKRLVAKTDDPAEENVLKEGDVIVATYRLTNLDTLLFFTDMGNYVFLPVRNIPVCRRKDLGDNISILAHISADETIIYQTAVRDFPADRYLLFITKNGLAKRTPLSEMYAQRFSKALQATKLREGDLVIAVQLLDREDEVLLVSKAGLFTKYALSEISVMAIASYGMIGLTFPKGAENDEVLAGFAASRKDQVLFVSKNALDKVPLKDLTLGKRTNVAKPLPFSAKKTADLIGITGISPSLIAKGALYIAGEKTSASLPLSSLGFTKKPTAEALATIKALGRPLSFIVTSSLDLHEEEKN